MPISGIGTGQLYLGGDGSLWSWGIFNDNDDEWSKCEGYRYMMPHREKSPLHQGFAIRWQEGQVFKTLDATGFDQVSFEPSFPTGIVHYNDTHIPFDVQLTAYTPYIPLDLNHSSYPAAVFDFEVKNTRGDDPVTIDLIGWIENYSLNMYRGFTTGTRINTLVQDADFCTVITSATATAFDPDTIQHKTIVFEDFNDLHYDGWMVTGEAFGQGPEKHQDKTYPLQGDPEGRMAHSMRPDDAATGRMLSESFEVDLPFINIRFAAGRMPHATGLRLLVEGEEVARMTGIKPRKLIERSWNVAPYKGRKAQIEIFDTTSQSGGYVIVDHIAFSNMPAELLPSPERAVDYGQLALALEGGAQPDIAALDLFTAPDAVHPQASVAARSWESALNSRPMAAIGRQITIPPGESRTVTFMLSWRFPNRGPNTMRTYAVRWSSMEDQLRELAEQLPDLRSQTRLFAATWRDSTLPHWLLNRILAPAAALNTNTVVDAEGPVRFTLHEGSNSLGGNCTHVWHYAQSAAWVFPEIERICRDEVELGVGYTDKAEIRYRATMARTGTAVDGSSGTILRVLREHQMSADNTFLEAVWPRTKKAMHFLIETYDPDENGITKGWQHNTLDQDWAGDIPWLTSMYLAALRASSVMATEMRDTAFSRQCAQIVERGRSNFIDRMWKQEYGYFVMREDPEANRPSPGTFEGCHVDQLLGEWWLSQIGLDPILPATLIRQALHSVYKYNFLPDVGPYRGVFGGGRWYAAPDEPGLIMATFPFGGGQHLFDARGGNAYLNECMTGFEWAAAANMIYHGLVYEGLQVVKALDDRYDPDIRNPYNEIECGDHYARAMASHSVLLALSGFRHHGPNHFIAFNPLISSYDFRAPFTASTGWGTYAQNIEDGILKADISLKWGTLSLEKVALGLSHMPEPQRYTVLLEGRNIPIKVHRHGDEIQLHFEDRQRIVAGQKLQIVVQ
jgi:uncharacterized protein (DUF608 family)